MTDAAIKIRIQKLVPGQLVELYTLDLTPIGESTTYNFCNGTMDNGDAVEFNSVVYTPLPVETSGWELSGEGKLPRPRLSISNVTGVLQAAIVEYKDLVGCELTRRRTFYQFLDGGSTPDPTALFPIETYLLNKKTSSNKFMIEWEIISPIDTENIKIPKKQALSECSWTYRYYVDGAFVYTNIECPYTGSNYFKDDGSVTANPAEDDCGRRLMDCKLRFGLVNALPFGGFPNIKRFTRVNTRS